MYARAKSQYPPQSQGIHMAKSMLLEGRRALVTGAGTGIGRAIAHALARAGARVAVTDKDEGAAVAVAHEIAQGAISARLDVTCAGDTDRVFDTVFGQFGGFDIVCANAGIS